MNEKLERLHALHGQIFGDVSEDGKCVIVGPVAEYDKLRDELLADLGEHAPCWEIDSRMWSDYSDHFKDENGFRPSGHYHSYAVVQKYISDLQQKYSRN